MATSRRTLSQAYRDNQQLQQFVLTDVTPTGKTLGTGSYGSVLEVKYKNLKCAAKKIHDSLLQADNEGVSNLVLKYQQECQLMAGLHHPNITQFLGLCFLPGAQLPLLVMERLEMNLDDLLEYVPNLPLPLKVSFLDNVCSGLDYLHNRQSPIVHRDLTAKNVLLNSYLVAKITDMGNSRMVNMRPGQLARTLSQLPGTLVYMPPEALDETHRYGPSLDIFSFGHLTLYTLTQVFPGNLLSSTYPDPNNSEHFLARTEVQRRQVYMEGLEALVRWSHPARMQLVRECLHNIPERRPSCEDLLGVVHVVRMEVEGVFDGSVMKMLDIGKVLLAKEMKEMKANQQRIEAENRDLIAQLRLKEREILSRDDQLQHLQQLHQEKDEQINKQERQLHDKDLQLQQLEQEKVRQQQEKDEQLDEEWHQHQLQRERDDEVLSILKSKQSLEVK